MEWQLSVKCCDDLAYLLFKRGASTTVGGTCVAICRQCASLSELYLQTSIFHSRPQGFAIDNFLVRQVEGLFRALRIRGEAHDDTRQVALLNTDTEWDGRLGVAEDTTLRGSPTASEALAVATSHLVRDAEEVGAIVTGAVTPTTTPSSHTKADD